MGARLKMAGFVFSAAGAAVLATAAHAAPKFNSGTSVRGVLAYQDSEDATQFHYIPLTTDAPMDKIKTFSVKHFGIGRSYFVQASSGEVSSRAGAIVSGTVVIDITDAQRQAITEQIKKDFKVDTPKLIGIRLSEVSIESTMLDKTLSFNEGLETKLPTKTVQIGSEWNFAAGSLNSGFGHLAAARQVGSDITANPDFGVNIVGKAEFQGDPWRAVVNCDLAKVWEQVRSKASLSVSVGWFRLGSATYSNIHQELKDSGACTFDMKEGSLSTKEYGRQVMEMTKTIFEAMNKLATEGEGFFKFDSNYPQAEAPSGGGGTNLFGWSVSLNGGYSRAYFKQEKKWNTTVSYTGRFNWEVPLAATLAVKCGPGTKQFFQDLNDASEPCVTQAKADALRDRLRKEGAAKLKKIEELEFKLAKGEITEAGFSRLLALYNRVSLTEFVSNFYNLTFTTDLAGKTEQRTERALTLGLTPEAAEQLEKRVFRDHAVQ